MTNLEDEVRAFFDNFVKAYPKEDVEITSQVQETSSKDFYWKSNINSDIDEYEKDFVFYDNMATFIITNLSETTDDLKYSITFTLGNKSCNINDLEIQISDGDGGSSETINVDDFTNYSSVWISNIEINEGADGIGDLQIKFDDKGASDDFWSLDELTLELSDRIIKVEGG